MQIINKHINDKAKQHRTNDYLHACPLLVFDRTDLNWIAMGSLFTMSEPDRGLLVELWMDSPATTENNGTLPDQIFLSTFKIGFNAENAGVDARCEKNNNASVIASCASLKADIEGHHSPTPNVKQPRQTRKNTGTLMRR